MDNLGDFGILSAILGVVGLLVGGVGAKFLEVKGLKTKIASEESADIRKELRAEIQHMREIIASLEEQIHHERELRYSLMDKYSSIKINYDIVKRELDYIKQYLGVDDGEPITPDVFLRLRAGSDNEEDSGN